MFSTWGKPKTPEKKTTANWRGKIDGIFKAKAAKADVEIQPRSLSEQTGYLKQLVGQTK